MSSAAPCREPPPAFAGGSVYARPWPDSTSVAVAAAAEAKVAPETWLESAWAAAAGLLDDAAGPEPPQRPAGGDAKAYSDGDFWPIAASSLVINPYVVKDADFKEGTVAWEKQPSIRLVSEGRRVGEDHFGDLYFAPADEAGPGDQLSTQIYRNKQLQDTLVQKEEELAQLQAENRHLKQFLNSALVRQLEEKAKKLLWQNGQKACGAFKRRLKAEGPPVPREPPHAPKARRSLLGDFSACEGPPRADVDVWVLRTLGLKDIDTIEEPAPANYSAVTLDPALGSFLQGPAEVGTSSGQPGVYRCDASAPADSGAREEPLPPGTPLLSSSPLAPCSGRLSPPSAPMAFTTSLSPHCNVKTHTFRQGQAFVRRDQDGGWKLTWVPKKPE
ncbi:UNVERIFIED_CONTAM: hypothetical protein K2H54_065414 [Gekko kuhli]